MIYLLQVVFMLPDTALSIDIRLASTGYGDLYGL